MKYKLWLEMLESSEHENIIPQDYVISKSDTNSNI